MAYNDDLTWDQASRNLEVSSRTLIRELKSGEETYQDLLRAQGNATDLAWGRILFETGDTGVGTLTMSASSSTISCLSGAGSFSGHRVGRDVQISNFSNAGNNQTTEITAKLDNDRIVIGNASGLVSETDNAARVQENPTQNELDQIDELQATALALNRMHVYAESTASGSAAYALMRDFT